MHPRIIHNHRLLDATKARLPSITSATLHGRGVFTTIAVHAARPFLWPEHWARISEHADRIGVDRTEFDEASVMASLARLIEANGVEHGRARVTFVARGRSGLWKLKETDGQKTDLLIMTGDARPTSDDGLALTVSPYRSNSLSPLAGLKTLNYLDHILAWEEARSRDFDEAVVVNERGEVVSATMANIFWLTAGRLHTPSLSTGALAGTTRARIIELAADMAAPHVEGVYDLSHLGDADEIFLTSAALGVSIVTTFDFHRYTVPLGSIALRLREALREQTLQQEA